MTRAQNLQMYFCLYVACSVNFILKNVFGKTYDSFLLQIVFRYDLNAIRATKQPVRASFLSKNQQVIDEFGKM